MVLGEQRASKSYAHKWLGIWMESGVLEKVLRALQQIGITTKAIDLSRISVDDFFSAGKGGEEEVEYGYKGKGVTTHKLVAAQGNPVAVTSTGANGDERQEVKPLLNRIARWIKSLIHRDIVPILEANKGYDSREVRVEVLVKKIFLWIPYRGKRGENKGVEYLEKMRWKVERGISWSQRKYRRLVVRWERRKKYWVSKRYR